MPSRPLTRDARLTVHLAALLARAGDDADHRTVADDVAHLQAAAGTRTDLLAEAVGLHTYTWPNSSITRRRELHAALVALELPGVDEWAVIGRARVTGGQHSTKGFWSPHEGRERLGESWSSTL